MVEIKTFEADTKVNQDYSDFISKDPARQKFAAHLSNFLGQEFKSAKFKPIKYHFSIYLDPESDFSAPMVEIVYPDNQEFETFSKTRCFFQFHHLHYALTTPLVI